MDTSAYCVDDGRAESAEENVEQDDTMEKSDVDNDSTTGTYVSCYPNTRRYSLANSMATNTRPPYRTDNQGYSVDMGGEDAKAGKETKIDIPTSQPPQYSAVHEKMADKKVKVCKDCKLLWRERASMNFASGSGGFVPGDVQMEISITVNIPLRCSHEMRPLTEHSIHTYIYIHSRASEPAPKRIPSWTRESFDNVVQKRHLHNAFSTFFFKRASSIPCRRTELNVVSAEKVRERSRFTFRTGELRRWR